MEKFAAFAIFEPFMANLITTDLKFPDLRRNACKILLLININAPFLERFATNGIGLMI